MRTYPILEDTYYHVFNRGNLKQTLFHEPSDYARFLFILLYFQSPHTVSNIHRQITHFLKHKEFSVDQDASDKIAKDRYVDILNLCIMPNHFHITVHNKSETGLSQYMHRVGNAYGKYYNKKYDQTGHVFQGTYKAVLVDTDAQLSYLSAYIHRNPTEIEAWKNKEEHYMWSSFQDYKENRWHGLLDTKYLMQSFQDFSDYKKFVKQSGAKSNFDFEI
ncbi:transposase [Candidatus Pacebacteria bacterium]|nr:transposase [Candidatus Paceibacterota bacterium]